MPYAPHLQCPALASGPKCCSSLAQRAWPATAVHIVSRDIDVMASSTSSQTLEAVGDLQIKFVMHGLCVTIKDCNQSGHEIVSTPLINGPLSLGLCIS